MPPPTYLLEWCTASLTSMNNIIQNQVQQILSNYSKSKSNVSQYLTAIQNLEGKVPGDKHKSLNKLIKSINENRHIKIEISDPGTYRNIPPALIALVRTTLAVKLRLPKLIIEGLKSDDVQVVKKALNADWFFDGRSEQVCPEYFIEHIMHCVSFRTRLYIIKKLSLSLNGYKPKAEEFFRKFLELFDLKDLLQILFACSENFIFSQILKFKITLSIKNINDLYKKYPNLIIEYLQLGNSHNQLNKQDRIIFEISVHEYDTFLPKLIEKHPLDFVQLYELTPNKALPLGKYSAKFLKNLKNVLIEKPKLYLKLLPLKMVSHKLTKTEFNSMFENLLPNNVSDFHLPEILQYLNYYPEKEKLNLLTSTYKKLYKIELIKDEATIKNPEFLKLLSNEDRELNLRAHVSKLELHNNYLCYLPPIKAIPILQMRILTASTAEERSEIINFMIVSCGFYNNKEQLLVVLNYYYEKHKNDRNIVFCRMLEALQSHNNLKTLEKDHWDVLYKILNHAYVKKELFKSHITLVESVLEAGLYNVLLVNTKESARINYLMDLMVECKVEYSLPTWNILKEHPHLEKSCIDTLFHLVPVKYNENHNIWKKQDDRIAISLNVVKTIVDYNKRNVKPKAKKRSKKKVVYDESKDSSHRLNIEEYPWITSLLEEFFSKTNNQSFRRRLLMRLLRKHMPAYYESRIDMHTTYRDIESGEALSVLKREPFKIMQNWPDYLDEARDCLARGSKAARRFIAATRWYDAIPVRFAETCLAEPGERGSMAVLAILLEGNVFEQRVGALAKPREPCPGMSSSEAREAFERARAFAEAARYASRPVSLELVSSFCQVDYLPLAERLMWNVARRLPADEVLVFLRRLSGRVVAARRLGIRVFVQISTKEERRNYLKELWRTEIDFSIRRMVARIIYECFTNGPGLENWHLMKTCIGNLTLTDREVISELADLERVHASFVGSYIDEYLTQLERLVEQGLDAATRNHCVCTVIESIDEKLLLCLPEEASCKLINRYFFDKESLEVSKVAQNFAIRSYLLPSGDRFALRLENIMRNLINALHQFDWTPPKKPRYRLVNYTISEFFKDVLTEISSSGTPHSLQIVRRMLRVFESSLSPWQEPMSYLSYSIYEEYLLAVNPRDFGYRCARRTLNLIEELTGSDLIVYDVAYCLEEFIMTKIYRDMNKPALKLDIINGLMEGDESYGTLIGIVLIDLYDGIEDYDEKYEDIMKSIRVKSNKTVQYFMYKHINQIKYNTKAVP